MPRVTISSEASCTYLITYSYKKSGILDFGNRDYAVHAPINKINHIREIEKKICEEIGADSVSIVSYRFLDYKNR